MKRADVISIIKLIAQRLLLTCGALIVSACGFTGGAKPVMPIEQGLTFYRVEQAKAPTVIMVPGCGGVQGVGTEIMLHKAQWLNAQGFNAVLLDYSKMMGIDNACLGQIKPDTLRKAMFASLNYVAAQPFVDRDHISLLGWSLGASAVLTMAQEIKPGDQPNIAAVAAYYPGCYRGLELSSHPTLLLLGLADNVVNPYDCIELVNRSPQAPVTMKTYWGAHHGFDAAEIKEPQTLHILWKTYTSAYQPDAAAEAEKALADFLHANSH